MCDVINCCPFVSLYFREVPDEVYRSLDAIGEGEKWWEVFFIPFLTCFINYRLLNYTVDEAAFDSTMCILLTEGTLNNKLVHLPAAIGELPMLKSLDLSQNSIVDIPEVIGSATSLVKLDCSNNKLKDLPNSLGRCSNLSELKVTLTMIDCMSTTLSKAKT
ncbi:Plant intracellular Ras-group-related LRR protein 6 [Vitis vinifera]|uniref:Plant intracellular Ras-group-related LRR protein 6 n=1 Tax=Vitis vinifera TaxID=29760 RepID=A0A438DLZ9_VITVI|nr:Plant intracellular Ras-group-related LRR protein 6 [Vitis vinifera]